MKRIIFLLLVLWSVTGYSETLYQLERKYYEGDVGSNLLSVMQGKVEGYSTIDKYGVNRSVTAGGVPADVWEFGGTYPYDAFGTAPIMYLSSSSADNDQAISVLGLDINGEEVSQIITLNGQSNVNLTTPLWRVYRMSNIADEGTGAGKGDIVGVVYCHTDPAPASGVPADENVRAIITGENNNTLMSVYTVPKGKVGFLYRGELGVAEEGNSATLAEYALVQYRSRRVGKVFAVKKEVTLMIGGGSATYQDARTFPDIIPSLTDIKITVVYVTEDMGVWAAFDILLVDEELFSTSYLQAIGQPGY